MLQPVHLDLVIAVDNDFGLAAPVGSPWLNWSSVLPGVRAGPRWIIPECNDSVTVLRL